MIGEVMGWIGAVLFIARQVPQSLRLLRTQTSVGVSRLGALNAISSTTGWLVYGLGVHDPVLWVPSVFALPFEVAIAFFVKQRLARRELAIGIGWACVVSGAWPLGGRAALGTVLGVGIVAGLAPHVLAAVRSPSLAGVAPRTWRIGILDGILWTGYGVAAADPVVTFYGVAMTTGSVFILARVNRWQRSVVPFVSTLGEPCSS